jgi:hypothetical protein
MPFDRVDFPERWERSKPNDKALMLVLPISFDALIGLLRYLSAN